MFTKDRSSNSIEILEARIAPASAITSAKFIAAITGSPILLHAGEVLTTAGQVIIPGVGNVGSGTYLLYVEKGDALVFTTDFNNNKTVDFNEITGIAAGDGLRLTSFVDIHGDIVTNLRPNTTLSDSNSNASDDDPLLKGDGRVVLNNTIEKIEMRSLTLDDVLDENGDGDTTAEVIARLALTSYSIHGNIYAGKGFGVVLPGNVADASSGLIIDDAGRSLQIAAFTSGGGGDFFIDGIQPTVGFVRTGSAVSGEWFSFSISAKEDVNGYLNAFSAPKDQVGGDIAGVHTVNPLTTFNIGGLIAGDGGIGARGGNIIDVTLNGDNASGYVMTAGTGGRGASGGDGGSILNFQDLSGSNDSTAATGQIVIRSGTGGAASTGGGGNGGIINFGTMTVNGGLAIELGSGGDGFNVGGNGASLAMADIVTPEGKIQFGTQNIASTHLPPLELRADGFPLTGLLPDTAYGVFGRHFGLDFDHDGFGDAVFGSSNPNELTVVFGLGDGTLVRETNSSRIPFASQALRISLDTPINPEAITVADFNQDGFPDIAVASSATANFSGITVFLAKSEDVDGNGILSDAEDLNHNHVVDFLGFRSGRQSTLPALSSADPDDPLLTGGRFGAIVHYAGMRSAVPITDIEAGDFNGDGITDLAVAATYIQKADLGQSQIIMFLTPDVENGRPTGQFYADVGTKAVAEPPQGANPLVPFFFIGGGTKSVIQATVLTTADTHDSLGAVVVGGARLRVLDNSFPTRLGPVVTATHLIPQNNVGPDAIDTDRLLGGNHISLSDPTFKDFVIIDSNNDGVADLSALDERHPNFLISWLSSSPGSFFDINIYNGARDNAGFHFDPNAVAIRDADVDGDGNFDNVAILAISPGGRVICNGFGALYGIGQMDIYDAPPTDIEVNPGANFNLLEPVWCPFFGADADASLVAFDTYYPIATNPAIVMYMTAHPDPAAGGFHYEEIIGDLFPDFVDISEHFIKITAGDGGDALIGQGGAGGFLGGSLSQTGTDLQGSLSIVLPANTAFSGVVEVISGKGGNGFSNGGSGGDITGTSVRYVQAATLRHTEASLRAGDGGFGVGGKGGDGGSLRSNSIESGVLFAAGNGGRGRFGGDGGEIVGHGIPSFYDSRDLFIELLGGHGGNGVKAGGNGGGVTDFHGDFDLLVRGGVAGLLSYIAGDGGNASAGAGGIGGSVINSSPLTEGSRLGGDILLQGGKGGNGLEGGDGGSINTFLYKPSVIDNPAVLSLLAGDGGKGISGRGGEGGSIQKIRIPSKGTPNPLDAPFPLVQGRPTPYEFNRFLAGNGGLSSGNVGGDGGIVDDVESSNSDGPFVVAAGAGGNGLFNGGTGGSITTTTLTVGGESLAKGLVIAGAGGSATAFIANPNDTSVKDQAAKAFGGRIGAGGHGGSINNFVQNGAIAARFDLIAGDGGSTLNYGTAVDRGVPVGIGGSITNVALAGNIGNIAPNVAIKSYNDLSTNQSVADFVNQSLRNPLSPGSFTDDVGLVGLAVGAAGRLKEVQFGYDNANNANFKSNPAFNGVNGDAMNISARNIMAMIAGNVSRIAAIQNIGGISVVANGILGADKTNDPAPYRDKDMNPVPEPVLDGKLVDGAIIYKTLVGGTLTGPRVFKLGT